jgi:predicted HTH transcriptional regulator
LEKYKLKEDFKKAITSCKERMIPFNACLMEELRKRPLIKKEIKPKPTPEFVKALQERRKKAINEIKIMQVFKEKESVSLEELVSKSGLDRETVKNTLNELIERGVIELEHVI